MKTNNEISILPPATAARPADSQESLRSCSTGPVAELSFCIMEQQCSYCSGKGPFVKEKTIIKFASIRLMIPRTPICGKCFLNIARNKLPVSSTSHEMSLMDRVSLIKSAASGLSKQTPLHKIKDLCDELTKMESLQKAAEVEFKSRAIEAEQAAKKIEWIKSCIAEAQIVVSGKLRTTYENCRKVANKCCSDIEIRNAVFSRDNFVCVICGHDENLSVDHIKPVKLGGTNELENLQTLCLSCNVKKGWKYDGKKLRTKRPGELQFDTFIKSELR